MSVPEKAAGRSSDLIGAALRVLAEALVLEVVAALERQPEHVDRLRSLLTGSEGPSAVAFISVERYAAHRAVSVRTIRYDLHRMEVGKHYHRAGRKGGRVVIHVEAADAWYAEHSRSASTSSSTEQLAIDEVTRRRARMALKKRKEE